MVKQQKTTCQATDTDQHGRHTSSLMPRYCRRAAKDAYFSENHKLTEANKEVRDLEARLELDLGSAGQFGVLHNR